MDTTFLPATLTIWLTQYGSFALFFLLALGIFALPIPDETLMVLAGVLVAHGKLSAVPTFIAASMGAVTGISLSYIIGRTAGTFLIKRYGHWLRLTEVKMQKVHDWFERVGRWALLIGYFIPGIRHLTGYAAGITEMNYRHFALFAYSGAVIWASLFLAIGYFLGDRWPRIEALLEEQWQQFALILVAVLVLAAIVIWWRSRKRNRSVL